MKTKCERNFVFFARIFTVNCTITFFQSQDGTYHFFPEEVLSINDDVFREKAAILPKQVELLAEQSARCVLPHHLLSGRLVGIVAHQMEHGFARIGGHLKTV